MRDFGLGSTQKQTRDRDWSYGGIGPGRGAGPRCPDRSSARDPTGARPLGTSSVTSWQPAAACRPERDVEVDRDEIGAGRSRSDGRTVGSIVTSGSALEAVAGRSRASRSRTSIEPREPLDRQGRQLAGGQAEAGTMPVVKVDDLRDARRPSRRTRPAGRPGGRGVADIGQLRQGLERSAAGLASTYAQNRGASGSPTAPASTAIRAVAVGDVGRRRPDPQPGEGARLLAVRGDRAFSEADGPSSRSPRRGGTQADASAAHGRSGPCPAASRRISGRTG